MGEARKYCETDMKRPLSRVGLIKAKRERERERGRGGRGGGEGRREAVGERHRQVTSLFNVYLNVLHSRT